MRRVRYILCLLSLLCLRAMAEPAPLGKYEIILKRKLFGDSPASKPNKRPTSPPPVIEKVCDYRLSALYLNVAGNPCIGLVHKKTQQSLTLPDPAQNDIKLQSLDFENNQAVIIQNQTTYTLKLTSAPAPTKPTRSTSKKKPSSRDTNRRKYLERSKKAATKNDANQEKKPRLHGKELQEHLQTYQMEVIRRGLPALPVQLTEESDRQLVEEGVLPAQ